MRYYAIAEIEVTDPAWVSAYVEHTTRLVEQHGGRYLARTSSFEKIEGERTPPQIFLLIEWPSKEAAETFYECEQYRPHREARRSGSTGEFVLVAGEDMTRTAAI